MNISVNVDARELVLRMRNGEKRLIYAVAAATNNTLLRIQAEERRQMRTAFVIRKSGFMDREIAHILPFANAREGRVWGEIEIASKPRLLLSIYELGGVRPAFKGKRVAVPLTGTETRPTFEDYVPTQFTYTKLYLKKTRALKGLTKSGRQRRAVIAGKVRQGEHGTYMIPKVGVFRRPTMGLKRRKPGHGVPSHLIYAFSKRPKLERQLRWHDTARSVANQWYPEELSREITKTVIHNSGR